MATATAYLEELFHVDRDQIQVKKGLAAWAALMLLWAFEGAFGSSLAYAMMAGFLVTFVGRSGDLRTRMVHMGAVTLIGTVIGALAILVGDTAWQAMLLFGVVTYLGGLAANYGKLAATTGYVFILWGLVTMLLATRDTGNADLNAAAFLVGGGVAMVVAAVRVWMGWVDASKPEAAATPRPSVSEAVTSPIGVFAAVRALMVAVSIGLGYALWSLEPMWPTITLIVVLQPTESQSIKTGIQRAIGSVAGGLLALALILIFPDFITSNGFIVYLLATSALCVVFYRANYLIYAFFMTQALVAYYAEKADVTQVGGQRIAGVLVGVALGFVGLWIEHLIMKARKPEMHARDTSGGAAAGR